MPFYSVRDAKGLQANDADLLLANKGPEDVSTRQPSPRPTRCLSLRNCGIDDGLASAQSLPRRGGALGKIALQESTYKGRRRCHATCSYRAPVPVQSRKRSGPGTSSGGAKSLAAAAVGGEVKAELGRSRHQTPTPPGRTSPHLSSEKCQRSQPALPNRILPLLPKLSAPRKVLHGQSIPWPIKAWDWLLHAPMTARLSPSQYGPISKQSSSLPTHRCNA